MNSMSKDLPETGKANTTQVTNSAQTENDPMNDKTIEIENANTNIKTNSADDTKSDKNGQKQVLHNENPKNNFSGNSAKAVTRAPVTDQPKGTTSSSSLTDKRHFGAKKDLFLYFKQDGQPRFGRGTLAHTAETSSGNSTNEYAQIQQTAEDDPEIQIISPSKNIPVRYTIRNQGSGFSDKFEHNVEQSNYQNIPKHKQCQVQAI